MSIKIGHASKDERGKYTGGAAGDQTGAEVYTRTWYNRPWTHVLRATDAAVREKLAAAMEHACANSKIGYDQGQRNTLLTAVRAKGYDPAQATTACETDCSALVCVCCMYAGVAESALYIGSNCATTSTLRARLTAAGGFETLTDSKYLTGDSYLLRGDILLYEGHHCAVALENGSKAVTVSATTTTTTTTGGFDMSTLSTVKSGVKGAQVKSVQALLNGKNGAKLNVDGSCGPLTVAAIKAYQTAKGLEADGKCGPKTWESLLTA